MKINKNNNIYFTTYFYSILIVYPVSNDGNEKKRPNLES